MSGPGGTDGTGSTDGSQGADGTGGNRPDTGDSADPMPADRASWCLSWETGLLTDAGYSGDFVELWDGALVLVAEEGDSYSALEGEELLDYRDDRALVLRSSHDGDTESTAIATTPLFEVEADATGEAHLWWWQLSGVDGAGIELYADLIDEAGVIVASLDLEVVTGGFVPALQATHTPITGFEYITTESYRQGALVQQATDLSPFVGQRLKLRLYQSTRVPNNGFFTVFDDVCFGSTDEGPPAAWGPPDPTH